ncbi:MAG TPA: glycosyltransferase, partial [Anaerolineales bacterium]|nr:glycosyltransferase [Anaerolineales bacterium]
MQIGVLAEKYPAANDDAFGQQREAVAVELARRGHDVHLITLDSAESVSHEQGLKIHCFANGRVNHFSPHAPELDRQLSASQSLCEGLLQCAADHSFDIVDVPLAGLLGLVTLQNYPGACLLSVDAAAPGRSHSLPSPTLEMKLAARLASLCRERAGAVYKHSGRDASAEAGSILELYQQTARARSQPRVRARRIYQVMEALDVGDAVSNIARRNAALLAELGYPRQILARYSHPNLRDETDILRRAMGDGEAGLIFHYWGLNHSTWLLSAVRGPKAVHYHNVTPAHYFSPDTELYHATAQARLQLQRIADRFDLVIADSQFNLTDFSQYLTKPKPSIVLYPVVDSTELTAAPYDSDLVAALRQPEQTNILFVGRVARNKRHDRVMQVFDFYYRNINRHSRLWLVGNDQVDAGYRADLESLRQTLPSGSCITFTGKVPESALYAYYRAADAFLCASE